MSDCCGPSNRRSRMPLITAIIVVAALAFVVAHGAEIPAHPVIVTQDAVGTADTFAEAIAKGDDATARALLLPNVLIYESGEAETSADEYLNHHLSADIAFMAGMRREVLSRETGGDGAASWVATKSRLRGQYKGKPVDLDSTETLILTFTELGWRISHIHWSSTPHREPSER